MNQRPLVIVHGYSDKGESFHRWVDILRAAGYETTEIHVADYITLSNEITIRDLAEGLDRAIRLTPGLHDGQEFDAIVHSTGMLVLRSWLMSYERRRSRLKHLIGLAPATFGSPLAHKGRSMLGAIFKGGKVIGPDFMEQGDLVLQGLELGSKFTWELAHQDFVGDTIVYGDDPDTPYPFIFVGLEDYGRIQTRLTNADGTDGTVRWAGAGFNCRKIRMDLTADPSEADKPRVVFDPWRNTIAPLALIPGHNHATILSNPGPELVEKVVAALRVSSAQQYAVLREQLLKQSAADASGIEQWQQFVIHLVDERGDGIKDFFIELYTMNRGELEKIDNAEIDVHAFTNDPSYRCFHVNLSRLQPALFDNLWLRLIASSGTQLVAYHGHGSERITPSGTPRANPGLWDAVIDLTSNLPRGATDPKFFYPFTTTLVEIQMNREPMPLELTQVSHLFKFLDPNRLKA
jgi:hypothetical protein